ncbi:MAG TPA: HEAT repeat domain-containing protein [Thermodesulfobacteriota bacterium]|nr:HEAT repeat domain-containing protein [Thermodesulfobacteriota bacterium]
MRTLPILAFFLAFPAAVTAFASPPAPPAAGGEAASLAERLSGIERIMWERDARSIPALRIMASKDADEKVRARAIGALTLLRDTGAPAVYLERLSSDPSPRVRRAAADAIGTLGIPPDRIGRLSGPLQKDTDPMVRAECARAIGKLGSRAAVGTLMYAVAVDPSPEVRSLAVEALFRLRAAEAGPILATSAREDPSPTVRAQAVRALAEISPVSSRDLFETLWRETADPDVRLEAYRALLRSADGSRWVEEGLGNAEVPIRFLALRTWFSRIPAHPEGIRPPRSSAEVVRLGNFLKDPARGIREFSRQSLEKLGYKTRPDGFAYSIDDR